jgi:hypothetical protein
MIPDFTRLQVGVQPTIQHRQGYSVRTPAARELIQPAMVTSHGDSKTESAPSMYQRKSFTGRPRTLNE